MFEAKVNIMLKKTVADPQGITIKHALESLGNNNVKDVRIGKLVKLNVDAENEESAKGQLEEMCQKLLANPIIEDYNFELRKI
ncbi:MAG: phosphoribosylformylglycinamidine synthase subunit PurS [Candidatus Omnitrophota bacterium]